MARRRKIPFTLRLFKAARALLGWSSKDLAVHTGLTRATVMDFESGRGKMSPQRVAHIKQAFESVGIKFLRDGIIYQGMTEEDKSQ